jgi:hypothetical protein
MPPVSDRNHVEIIAAMGRLKRLAVLLIILCFLLGGFCAYLIRAVNREYSALVGQSLGTIGELHKLTRHALSAQRAILATLVGDDVDNLEALARRVETELVGGRRAREEIRTSAALARSADLARAIDEQGRAYEATVGDVLKLLAVGNTAEANRLRHDKARVALDLYLKSIEEAAQVVEAGSLKNSEAYAARVRSHSAIVFGLAGLPVLFMAAIAATVVAVLVTMWLVMRRAGFEEGP